MNKVTLVSLAKNCWGYIPKKNELIDFVCKRVGHPHPYGRLRVMQAIKFIDSHAHTLDAGCGEGIFSRELAMRGIPVTGTDIDADALEACKNNAALLGIQYPIVEGSVERLPFASQKFDQVLATDVIEHVNHPEAALKEINRVFKKGGNFVMSVPTPLYLHKSILPVNFDTHLKEIGHVTYGWYLEDIKTVLEKNGFMVTDHSYYGRGITRLAMEIIYYLTGPDGIRKNRKRMYQHNLATLLLFFLLSPFLFIDRFYKNDTRGACLAVKSIKAKDL